MLKKSSKMVKNLNLESFQDKVHDFSKDENNWNFKGNKPCIIDFYADWCGPCKTLGPILEDISEEYEGKVDIYKINTENERELAAAFGIRSIPSILFIPQGNKPQMQAGLMDHNAFRGAIKNTLKVA
jgi:thioredoxin 1